MNGHELFEGVPTIEEQEERRRKEQEERRDEIERKTDERIEGGLPDFTDSPSKQREIETVADKKSLDVFSRRLDDIGQKELGKLFANRPNKQPEPERIFNIEERIDEGLPDLRISNPEEHYRKQIDEEFRESEEKSKKSEEQRRVFEGVREITDEEDELEAWRKKLDEVPTKEVRKQNELNEWRKKLDELPAKEVDNKSVFGGALDKMPKASKELVDEVIGKHKYEKSWDIRKKLTALREAIEKYQEKAYYTTRYEGKITDKERKELIEAIRAHRKLTAEYTEMKAIAVINAQNKAVNKKIEMKVEKKPGMFERIKKWGTGFVGESLARFNSLRK